MLKYPVTILLILLIGLQTFSKWCLIVEYQVNRDFIAKNLCINRLKPCCCCHGKCYLNKKMAADESQQQTPGKGAQKDETPLQTHRPDYILPSPAIAVINSSHSTRHLARELHGHSLSFYPPPKYRTFIPTA